MENRDWTRRDDLHRAFGCFVSEFATMVSRLRTATALLVMGDLGVEYQWRFQFVVAGYSAQSLADAFFGLLSARQDFEHDERARNLVKRARGEVNHVIEVRNELVHGDGISPFHADDAGRSSLHRIRPTRKAGALEVLPQSAADLDRLAEDATRLQWVISAIATSTLTNPDGTPHELQLTLNADGKVVFG